jgi:steroid 5-alpha reductase family enzyme
MSPLLLVLTATAALGLAFTVVFFVARRIDNYGIVDIAWSYAFAALAAYYALAAGGWPVRRALLGALVCLWSLRLGTHLYVRVMGHHPEEDGRYRAMRTRWAANFMVEMFKFFQLQAVSVVFLGAAFLAVSLNPAPALHPLELRRRRALAPRPQRRSPGRRPTRRVSNATPPTSGKVCDVGLWRYSRHPNYFFEWLIWVAFFVFALGSPWGWIGIIGPASILYLLLRVTGIPHERGAKPSQPRRRLPPLPADHERLRAVVSRSNLPPTKTARSPVSSFIRAIRG